MTASIADNDDTCESLAVVTKLTNFLRGRSYVLAAVASSKAKYARRRCESNEANFSPTNRFLIVTPFFCVSKIVPLFRRAL